MIDANKSESMKKAITNIYDISKRKDTTVMQVKAFTDVSDYLKEQNF
jgi:hypothetical protein